MDRLLDLVEPADVGERRRGARLELEGGLGAVGALVPRDLHHALEPQGGVDRPAQLRDALDHSGVLGCVGEVARQREIAAVDGRLAGRE